MTLTSLPVRPVPPYERVALVLPGGGALGAYQVGVYQAMDELGVRPDWVAGVSIGALNVAVIAGNPPEQRVRRLQEFWRSISQQSYWPWPVRSIRLVNDALSTLQTSLLGNPGFFRPWLVNPWLAPRGSDSALSYYDPLPIRRALERFVDFDRIRAGQTRLSLGAVNARTGQVRYFDSTRDDIGVEHVLASLALPPAFPPVEIEGELYWDGGVVSNTPLDTVLEDAQGVQLSQEYDFSELSVEDRMRAGYEDAVAGYARLRRGGTPAAMSTPTGVSIYDFNAASPVNAESPELEEEPAKPVEAA